MSTQTEAIRNILNDEANWPSVENLISQHCDGLVAAAITDCASKLRSDLATARAELVTAQASFDADRSELSSDLAASRSELATSLAAANSEKAALAATLAEHQSIADSAVERATPAIQKLAEDGADVGELTTILQDVAAGPEGRKRAKIAAELDALDARRAVLAAQLHE